MIKNVTDFGRLIKGVSFSWVRFLLTILIGIIQTPLLFKNLAKDELNFWYIFFLFGAFLQMADLGLIQTLSRIIAYIDNANESSSDNHTIADLSSYSPKQIYTTSLLSFCAILTGVSIVVVGIYYVMYSQAVNATTLQTAFCIYVVGIVFSLLSNIPAALLIGYRDVGVESIVRSVWQILYFALLFVLLPVYKSVVLVAVAFMFQNMGQLISLHLTLYVRHKYIFENDKTPRRQLFQYIIAKRIYSQSFPLVINQFGGWLIAQGSVLMASIIVSANEISDYVINQQLFTYVTSIALVVNQVISPFIAKKYIQDRFAGLQSLFVNTMVVCLSIVGAMLVILLVCGENIITLWVGSKHFLGTSYAIVFSLITFFEVQHSVAGNFVWNTGVWPFNKWTLLAGLLTVTLGFALSQFYGLLGIALASLLSKLLTLNWYVVYISLKRLGLSVKGYLAGTLSPLVLVIFTCILLAFYTKHQPALKGINEVMKIAIVSTVSGVVFLLLISFLFRKSFFALYQTFLSRTVKT
ncbi:lipopolysaccharide biosynthesis protein [Spirosoma montaniterrae]|uniref:Polysaccharide biosynthesis protein n=1 Tax=Spirosoma montaniterrae TaxID=1178516 RepID=A0A1P9X111_9BACT|nr:hypothetical protein [Spirosoma montaniterrae]AQG81319.1 hypothetical protein AWR27_19540 [Spirosoma montaniterrae]